MKCNYRIILKIFSIVLKCYMVPEEVYIIHIIHILYSSKKKQLCKPIPRLKLISLQQVIVVLLNLVNDHTPQKVNPFQNLSSCKS